MKIRALRNGEPCECDVYSNVLGALHLVDSICVCADGERRHFKTVSDFLAEYEVKSAETHYIRVPFVHSRIGLGEVAAMVAERFPLYIKQLFNGCQDRRYWLNLYMQFLPLK